MDKKVFKLLGSVIVLSVAIAAGYYLLFVYQASSPLDIYRFTGHATGLRGDVVTLNGVYSADELPAVLQKTRDFSFTVDEKTKFTKHEIKWPSWEELRATGTTSGTINFKDLPQSRGEATPEDFKQSLATYKTMVYVEAEFSSSIYNAENPVASKVFYQVITVLPPEDI